MAVELYVTLIAAAYTRRDVLEETHGVFAGGDPPGIGGT
jgi:hypothetical protein